MPIIAAIVAVFLLISVGITGNFNNNDSQNSQASVASSFLESEETTHAVTSDSDSSSQRSRNQNNVETEPEAIIVGTPIINTVRAQDIDDSRATLRGEVNMNGHTGGVVFFVYGYSEILVGDVTTEYDSFEDIPDVDSDKFRTYRVDSRAEGLEFYDRSTSRLINDTEYFFQICVEYENTQDTSEILCGGIETFDTDEGDTRSGRIDEADASTQKAIHIESDEAILEGRIDMNDSKEGTVFFVYGENREDAREVDTIYDTYISIRENDEELEKIRVERNVIGRNDYSFRVTGLDDDTEYFFQICVEYDGDTDGLVCGGVYDFVTDGSSREDKPDATTDGVGKITSSKAEIRGHIDMNDFFNGLAFFVYGLDRSLVGAVSQEDEYSDIRQDGDDLQRVSVDTDLDGRDTYLTSLSGLKSDSEYSYRICVEYEDEDEDGDEELFLECGDLETFETK